MHLRENHIIPEIIDEAGNVLPDGQYGELVLTTVGADAMPLIRYRTGDYTRILPQCPCGGVTKRLDTVSRRENSSIESLDSILFRIPGLIDYRAGYDGKLRIHCLYGHQSIAGISDAVQEKYPQLEAVITGERITRAHRPMYLGKRQIL
jgi:hypothetical protein